MSSAISLGGGFALGLASSLHCIGMCGGITLLLGLDDRPESRTFLPAPLLLHGGRIASYMVLGAVTGGLGSSAFGSLGGAQGYQLLRWAAAFSLGWIGLSTAGLLPMPALLVHVTAPRRALDTALSRFPSGSRQLASGLAWGLFPCGMVYGALLFSLFSGSAAGGATIMLGFGLGTLPALVAASFGFGRFRTLLRSRGAGRLLGLTMVMLAMASLIDSHASIRAFCSQLVGTFTG